MSFTNPVDALERARTDAPDLLISDVMMPQLAGIDLAIQMKKECLDVRYCFFPARLEPQAGSSSLPPALETSSSNGSSSGNRSVSKIESKDPIRVAGEDIGLAHEHHPRCARLSRMLIILIILLLLFGGGGYYMGPGVGYYGGGGISLILLVVILYLLFGRGRGRI